MKCTLVAVLTALKVVITSAVSLEEFYPYGLPDNKQILTNDDGSSLEIHLDPPLRLYGRNYNTCHVNNNGIVSFNNPPEHFKNDPFPIEYHILLAPFFGDVDTRKAGTVWYTDPVSNDSVSLQKATEDLREIFINHECDTFSPKYVIVATWDHVGYFKEQNDKKNTFQCVIATDGRQSYAIFLYNEIEWTTQYDPDDPNLNPTPAKVGFNDGYLNKSFEVPCSRTPEIVNITMSSNVGRPGVWIFRIDGEEVIPACVNEDQETQCNANTMCYNGQACLTADYDFICMPSSEFCEKATDGVEGHFPEAFIVSVFVPLIVLVYP